MSVQQKRKYDPEFKKQAVLLTAEPGRSVREVAENLGVSCELIYRWRRQMRAPWLSAISPVTTAFDSTVRSAMLPQW